MKKFRVLGVMLISVALLLGSVGTALAQEGATPTPEPVRARDGSGLGDGPHQGLFGTVNAITSTTITIDTNVHGELGVLLTDDTNYKIPGQGQVEVSREEMEAAIVLGESRVAILATEEAEEYTAVRVMLVPGKATRRHLCGVVTSVNEQTQTMTIAGPSGETTEVEIPVGGQGGQVGQCVSAAVRQNGQHGKPEVTGMQTAEQVRQRLQNCINQLDGDSEGQNEEKIQSRLQLRQRLAEKMEGLMERHENNLRNVLQRHGDGESEGPLQQALQQMQQLRDRIGAHADDAIGSTDEGPNQQGSQHNNHNGE